MESQLSVKILSVYQLSFNLSFVGYVDFNNLLNTLNGLNLSYLSSFANNTCTVKPQ